MFLKSRHFLTNDGWRCGQVGRLGYNGGEDRCQICEIRGHTQCRLHCTALQSSRKYVKMGGRWMMGGHNASTAFYHRASIKSLAHNMYSNIGHSRKEYVMMGFRCPGHTKCNSPSFCFHMHQTNSQIHNLEHYCTIDQAFKGLYTFLCILQHLRQL